MSAVTTETQALGSASLVLADLLADPVPFASMPVRSGTLAHHRTEARDDPYYSAMFDASSRAAWTGRDLLLREIAAGARLRKPRMLSRLAASADPDADVTPLERLLGANRKVNLRALAAINMFRTLTVPQLAAIIGHQHPWTSGRWPSTVSDAFAAALVQVGQLINIRVDTPHVLRVDPAGDGRALLDRLDYDEWLGVTSGQTWLGSNSNDRHGVLVTELALRIAQMCPGAGAVLGELLAGQAQLTAVGQRRFERRRADAVVVRRDGLRIALEATASDRYGNKMENWVELLVADKSKSTVVVFVEVARPGYSSEATSAAVWDGLQSAVTGSISAMGARVLERMFFVRWSDWFPAPGMVTPDFARLPVTAYAGAGPGQRGQWKRVDLLDPAQVQCDAAHVPGGAMSVLHNSSLLLGCPKILTDRYAQHRPATFPLLREHAGLIPEKTTT